MRSVIASGIAALLLAWAGLSHAAATEDSPLFWGVIPKDTPTYAIEVGNQPVIQGVFGVRGELGDPNQFKDLDGLTQITVVFDTPWEPYEVNTTKAQVALGAPELPGARLDRLRKGWQKSPYDIVDGRRVARADLELAAHAQEAAAKVHDRIYPAVTVQESASPSPEPGFMTLYGWHIAILVAAVLAMVVVLKGMVFR